MGRKFSELQKNAKEHADYVKDVAQKIEDKLPLWVYAKIDVNTLCLTITQDAGHTTLFNKSYDTITDLERDIPNILEAAEAEKEAELWRSVARFQGESVRMQRDFEASNPHDEFNPPC